MQKKGCKAIPLQPFCMSLQVCVFATCNNKVIYVYNIYIYTVYKIIPFYICAYTVHAYPTIPTHGVIWLIHPDSLSNVMALSDIKPRTFILWQSVGQPLRESTKKFLFRILVVPHRPSQLTDVQDRLSTCLYFSMS